MSEWPPRLVFTGLPCLVGAYAAALFLTTRPIPAKRAWSLGLLIASLLTVGASIAMRPLFSTATASILESFACLYFIPTIVLVATALALRSRAVGRGVGVTVLVALFLASTWAAGQAAFHFIGFINAGQ